MTDNSVAELAMPVAQHFGARRRPLIVTQPNLSEREVCGEAYQIRVNK